VITRYQKTELQVFRPKRKKKAPTATSSTVSERTEPELATAADIILASLSNNKSTSSSAKSKSKPSQPDTGDDPYDKDFVPPKRPTRRSVEPEIEEILLDQFGYEIVDNLPEVSAKRYSTLALNSTYCMSSNRDVPNVRHQL
jgi:hypothetical protein